MIVRRPFSRGPPQVLLRPLTTARLKRTDIDYQGIDLI